MKQLENKVKLKSVGIPGLNATLVKRDNNLCMYKRGDGVYEVFKPNITKRGTIIFGKIYDDDTESYPCNEDFGSSAWCYPNKKLADEGYNDLLSSDYGQCDPGESENEDELIESTTKN